MERKKIKSTIKGYMDIFEEEGMTHVPMKRKNKKPPLSEKKEGSVKEDKKTRVIRLQKRVSECTLCNELAKTRKNVVFGAGNVSAELMFVGEAPGRDEDIQGLPFVGRAGQLLTKMIEAMGLTRQHVFIANVLKCRPPQNRNPLPKEIINCEPYLLEQLELIKPKVICALGTFAAQTLLKKSEPISRLRGRFYDYHGIKLLPTFHPAYLLRSPGEKKKAWADLKMIKKELKLN